MALKSRENDLILWFIHSYKIEHLQELYITEGCKVNSKLGIWKGYLSYLLMEGIRKGYLFFQKRYKRWGVGPWGVASPYKTLLSIPPPPHPAPRVSVSQSRRDIRFTSSMSSRARSVFESLLHLAATTFVNLMNLAWLPCLTYNKKFLRHVYFAILMCAYFATLKFRDIAKILYFESLLSRVFKYHN